jgi:hypothetical protein
VLAKYEIAVPKPIMLIVDYENAKEVNEVWKTLSLLYNFRGMDKAVIKDDENDSYIGFKTSDNVIYAVFQANRQTIRNLLNI